MNTGENKVAVLRGQCLLSRYFVIVYVDFLMTHLNVSKRVSDACAVIRSEITVYWATPRSLLQTPFIAWQLVS